MHPLVPDTTTPKRYRRSNLLLVLAALSVTFMLFSPHLVSAQNGQSGSCPGAQVVDTFSGSGNQTTPVFETTGESFRVSFDSTPTAEPELASLSIFVNGSQEDLLNTISDEGGGSGQSFVNAGPGSYSLDILSANLEYEVTVEDCTGGSPGGGEPPVGPEPPEKVAGPGAMQYEDEDTNFQQTPPTGGPPLSVVVAVLLWFGVGGILVARRFAWSVA